MLCTTIWGDVKTYKFGKPAGHDKPHFWLGAGIMDEYVSAWQPLPEPYKGGADMRKPNCVTCDHFGKCEGCEKGEEE